jgi:Protein of unknown function (DUF3073)
MGRGRAKAKQTKVARELKYRTPNTDLSSLERELRGEEGHEVPAPYADLADPATDDYYPAYADPSYVDRGEELRKSG